MDYDLITGEERPDHERITGGVPITKGEFPSFVILTAKMTSPAQPVIPICGGSILNNYFVLTTAHCCQRTDVHQIIGGVYNISDVEERSSWAIRVVKENIPHPNFV